MTHPNDLKALEAFVQNNPELEKLEAELSKFNIFEAVGVIRQELRHSDFLAFLLDPNQNHGLSDKFLKRILSKAWSDANFESHDFGDAIVLREWQSIDILVVSHHAAIVIAFENKVNSSEHSDQLRRYRDRVQRRYSNYRHIFIFLTIDGSEPFDEEDKDIYLILSYRNIAEIIDEFLNEQTPLSNLEIETLLRHYVTMLRRHIVPNKTIENLCVELYHKHKRALDLIFEHRPDVQLEIQKYLETIIGESSLVSPDLSEKRYIRFLPKAWTDIDGLKQAGKWTGTRNILLFEFENDPNYLSLKLLIGPGKKVVRQAILNGVNQYPHAFGLRKVLQLQALESKYIKVYERPILNAGISTLDDAKPQIDNFWQSFLSTDFLTIQDILLTQINWQEIEAQLQT